VGGPTPAAQWRLIEHVQAETAQSKTGVELLPRAKWDATGTAAALHYRVPMSVSLASTPSTVVAVSPYGVSTLMGRPSRVCGGDGAARMLTRTSHTSRCLVDGRPLPASGRGGGARRNGHHHSHALIGDITISGASVP
jgi:hypothetical protein